MKLIADSGSTKTDWAFIKDNEVTGSLKTDGINPFFRKKEDIYNELHMKLIPEISEKVDEIYFYGAGIINDSKGAVISQALKELFSEAKIETNSDLIAAARSTCGKQKGIVCILGTGSNSCLYDGEKIAVHVSPLGFILGDEGSGAVMGRKLIGDYLKNIMPAELRKQFGDKYKLNGAEIMENVYRKEKPNLYLSQFTEFVSENLDKQYCTGFLKNEFEAFVERNLLNYKDIYKLPIHFVGSIAFIFQDILKEVIESKSLNCGKIIRDPMKGLVEFHTNMG
ncbi:MAG: ATPase [Prolixibacteraceae bacterium]|nr:ATPase [Prolixibacteraceae bacterium]